jgi:acyl-coenzyme A thioesterase PaaI-like protein
MPESFEAAIALERTGDNQHRWTVPDGWQQGRGAFGGLVLGAMMAAMADCEPDRARLPRAFTGDLCAPALPTVSRIVSRPLRRGSRQSNWAAVVEQDGALVAHATCVMAAPRRVNAPPRFRLDPPSRPPYDEVPVLPVAAPFGPTFAQHYEYRATGPLPFSGSAEAQVLGWVKERVPLARMTAAALIARLDAHWPGLYSVETAPRPAATVSFLAEILCDPSRLDPLAPLFYRARCVADDGGYFVEFRELWDGDEPVALNQQSFAMMA